MWKIVAVFCLYVQMTYGAVNELTDNDFYSYAAKKQVLLVNFYAPWCSDCANLNPHFEGAATTLGPRGADLAKVDCFGAGKGMCEMYSVKSWPQLKSFHFGTYNGDYTGPQTTDGIANYINTVENSAAPQVAPEQPAGNPYAGHLPGAAQPAAGFNKQPVATSLSCAKCKIEKPKGKINKGCTSALKKQCITSSKDKKSLSKAQMQYGEDDK
eukprot:TCONS_00009153-protein